MKKKRVNIYIDGFNFYYGLKSSGWKKFYWLDIVAFFELFMNDDEELQNIYYCTAKPLNTKQKNRQSLLFSANKLNPKFNLIFGKFLEKEVYFGGIKYKTFEEKQTDVNIAVNLIKNVVIDDCDVSIIVSADSDLIPPIKFVKELYPDHLIKCFFPPNRHSVNLQNFSDSIINLVRYESRFKKCILPDKITLNNGHEIEIPLKWKV